MYNLNPNTRTARFYSWIWDTDVTKIRSMCPYFWKYVVTILILPLPLLYKLVDYIMPKSKKVDNLIDMVAESAVGRGTGNSLDWLFSHTRLWNAVGKILKWTFVIFLGGILLLTVILLVMLLIDQTMKTLAALGVLALVAGGALLLAWLFTETNLGSILWTPFKFMGNMVYNLYKNICPLVTWTK